MAAAEIASFLQEVGLVDAAISQDDVRLLPVFAAPRTMQPGESGLGWFDITVCWTNSRDRNLAASLRRHCARQLLMAPSMPSQKGVHVADHLMDTLKPLGITAKDVGIPPQLPGAMAARSAKMPAAAQRQLVIIHPGSGSRRKNWPAGKFARVASILTQDYEVALLCGPADELAVQEVADEIDKPIPVYRGMTLRQLAAVLSSCTAYLGNDSGVTHLAGLLGVPTVALFGPTDPAVWGPRGRRVTILRWRDGDLDLTPEKVASVIIELCQRRVSD